MTKEAALSDGAGEVGVCDTFISGSQIIALPAAIISDRRLKEMVSQIHDVSTGMGARPDHVIHVIAGGAGPGLQGLPRSLLIGVHADG
jgi:hypothetical protein